MLKNIRILIGLLAFVSTAAHSQTFDFGGTQSSGPNASSLYFTASSGIKAELTGYSFANDLAPQSLGGLNLLSSVFTGNVTLSHSDRGVGICSSSETGGFIGNSDGCQEIDSADEQGAKKINVNEALLVSFLNVSSIGILQVTLNIVDDNDTFGIYGVSAAGALTQLGFSGTIKAPVSGFSSAAVTTNTNREFVLTFAPQISGYSRYLFTTMSNAGSAGRNGGDGYRLHSINAVPEPAAWAMMLFGFGAIGFQLRRSRRRSASAIGTNDFAVATD